MPQVPALRRALRNVLGLNQQHPVAPPAIEGYSVAWRTLAGLLGMTLPHRATSAGSVPEPTDGDKPALRVVREDLNSQPGRQPSSPPPEDTGFALPITAPDTDAANLVARLASGLQADLPVPAEYSEGSAALDLTPTEAITHDLEMRLRAPSELVNTLAGTAILLSFRSAGIQDTNNGSDVTLFSRLDHEGVARFRTPGSGTITGVGVPVQRNEHSRMFTQLPALAKHAPAAATADNDVLMRRQAVLASPPVTVSAYETPDRRMTISVEGLTEPEPDTALLIASRTGTGPLTSWALPLGWSPALGGIRASLIVGPARGGLEWELDPVPVRLADLSAEILRRSQRAADERSSKRIAEILASKR
jgi:hypothetical protein